MNDFSPPSRTGSAELPQATVYDPAEDSSTPFGAEQTGTVVVLLVGDVDRRWAAETAIELSTSWARHGRRIVLADLHLENPVLHERLGGDNLEGVVDVFLYGASLSHSARAVPGRSFFFLPAGTYTPDVRAIYEHPRWPKLLAGFHDAGASLVLFAPATAADLEALAGRAGQVILLGSPRAPEVLAPFLNAGREIRGLIVPPSADLAPRVVAEPDGFAEHEPEVVVAPRPKEVRPVEGDEEDELHLPPPPVRPPHRGHRAAVTVLLVLLGVAVLAAIGYAVASLRPDLVPGIGAAESAGPDSAAAARRPLAAPPAPTRVGDPLPYSVQVIAYKSLQSAGQQLSRIGERVPAVLFFIAPEDIQGVLYYKILAGALPDTAIAQEIKGVLVASRVINEEDASGAWDLIQRTPLAFQLNEYSSRDAAEAAVDSLMERRIPAYPVAVPYSDSTQRWQLFAGAYSDSASADAMRRLLAEAGLQTRLVTRAGLSTAAQE